MADLLRAQRLMERVQDEIDPQFRIASPEGDWWIGITLSPDLTDRQRQLQLVVRFMAWKLSPAFNLACGYAEPPVLACFGITHRERLGAIASIGRNPVGFGPIEWLNREEIGEELPALLPRGEVKLDAAQIAELEDWFGLAGRFPALKIETS